MASSVQSRIQGFESDLEMQVLQAPPQIAPSSAYSRGNSSNNVNAGVTVGGSIAPKAPPASASPPTSAMEAPPLPKEWREMLHKRRETSSSAASNPSSGVSKSVDTKELVAATGAVPPCSSSSQHPTTMELISTGKPSDDITMKFYQAIAQAKEKKIQIDKAGTPREKEALRQEFQRSMAEVHILAAEARKVMASPENRALLEQQTNGLAGATQAPALPNPGKQNAVSGPQNSDTMEFKTRIEHLEQLVMERKEKMNVAGEDRNGDAEAASGLAPIARKSSVDTPVELIDSSTGDTIVLMQSDLEALKLALLRARQEKAAAIARTTTTAGGGGAAAGAAAAASAPRTVTALPPISGPGAAPGPAPLAPPSSLAPKLAGLPAPAPAPASTSTSAPGTVALAGAVTATPDPFYAAGAAPAMNRVNRNDSMEEIERESVVWNKLDILTRRAREIEKQKQGLNVLKRKNVNMIGGPAGKGPDANAYTSANTKPKNASFVRTPGNARDENDPMAANGVKSVLPSPLPLEAPKAATLAKTSVATSTAPAASNFSNLLSAFEKGGDRTISNHKTQPNEPTSSAITLDVAEAFERAQKSQTGSETKRGWDANINPGETISSVESRGSFDAPVDMVQHPAAREAFEDLQRQSMRQAYSIFDKEKVEIMGVESSSGISKSHTEEAATAANKAMQVQPYQTKLAMMRRPSEHSTVSSILNDDGISDDQRYLWVRKGMIFKRYRQHFATIIDHQFFGMVLCLFVCDSGGHGQHHGQSSSGSGGHAMSVNANRQKLIVLRGAKLKNVGGYYNNSNTSTSMNPMQFDRAQSQPPIHDGSMNERNDNVNANANASTSGNANANTSANAFGLHFGLAHSHSTNTSSQPHVYIHGYIKHAFVLRTHKKEYHFACDDKNGRNLWMEQLQRCIKIASSQ